MILITDVKFKVIDPSGCINKIVRYHRYEINGYISYHM